MNNELVGPTIYQITKIILFFYRLKIDRTSYPNPPCFRISKMFEKKASIPNINWLFNNYNNI
ncbi:hypothetical protein SAMN05444395_10229 [Flavobacterium fryxellicola]|uniref:Uncharacterized protein n=1 Tax=Flavobacterium fryxellicola TaxID=249352 RepID=A0A167YAH7_9FLAO|nr:hypothetical protein FBFR_07010 [Flavobacterium fryxellicola]SHN57751.1 hypothetical protein SAMN05444395_10229 [Flavobacterium fryxellicola]